jgi:hypothetical protein
MHTPSAIDKTQESNQMSTPPGHIPNLPHYPSASPRSQSLSAKPTLLLINEVKHDTMQSQFQSTRLQFLWTSIRNTHDADNAQAQSPSQTIQFAKVMPITIYSPLRVDVEKSAAFPSTPGPDPGIIAKDPCHKETSPGLAAFQCRAFLSRAVGADGSLASGMTLECVKGTTIFSTNVLYYSSKTWDIEEGSQVSKLWRWAVQITYLRIFVNAFDTISNSWVNVSD